MKDTPMILTPENAQKTYEGLKWKTRRIIKPQPPEGATIWQCEGVGDVWQVRRCDPWHSIKCPWGTTGDLLWVREAWAKRGDEQAALYKGESLRSLGAYGSVKWTPSIHMPKWACRTHLEILSVKVERLQDISEADVVAEGGPPSHPSIDVISQDLGYKDFSRSWFAQLWASIHGPESWDLNPFVWVIEWPKFMQRS